jgi:hypothetical protein
MSVPPDQARSDKLLEKGFAVLLGIFALAVVLMLAFVIYSCFRPELPKKSMDYQLIKMKGLSSQFSLILPPI